MDMDVSGNIYFIGSFLNPITYDVYNVYKCTDATTCTAFSVTGLDNTVSGTATTFGYIRAIKVDSTGANIYVYDASFNGVTNIIYKCSTSTGACTTYLSPTTSIGKALDGTALELARYVVGAGTVSSSVSIGVDARYYYYYYFTLLLLLLLLLLLWIL